MGELKLMKGNEAFAEACIRAGADAYFGYPITPQSEVLEYLMAQKPYETTGMVVLQAESEVSAINMCYGAGGAGFKVVTSSSSPGISLKQEGISYMAGAELPLLVLNVVRGGPGLGDIQPSQSDYFQATKGGGHGDYRLYVLAPSSVQEMSDFVPIAFEMAFKYRNPVMILSDGVIGQMMEKVELFDPIPRRTIEQVEKQCPWATTGKKANRERNIDLVIVGTDRLQAFGLGAAAPAARRLQPLPAGAGAAEIYAARCAACHEQAQGNVPPRSLIAQHAVERLMAVLGTGAMRAHAEGLDRAQIESLARFLREGAAR
ncbi:MAG TPA: hypothetical protein PKG63_07885 [Bacteroidales bacterium]|nr:hypothetical protein [Bacteroidales bacterium]